MTILTVDPGATESGYCFMNDDYKIIEVDKAENGRIRDIIIDARMWVDMLVIEEIIGYGGFGDPIVQTVRWTGRFQELWNNDEKIVYVPRKTVTGVLAGVSGNDSVVRRVVLDSYARLFPDQIGEGSEPAIGTKKKPGILHGVKGSDKFSAIALGLWYFHVQELKNRRQEIAVPSMW